MLILYTDSFKSKIGSIYYIWENKNPVVPTLAFLANNEKSFKGYLEKLKHKYSGAGFHDKSSSLLEKSILSYFTGAVKSFDISYQFLTGNDFEQKIWNSTASIPYGQVLSYKEIAEKAGYPGAWRAAGTALGHNPIMIVVPCHRVIKSSGEIGRFGGGEDIKKFLLEHELGYTIKQKAIF